MTPVKQTQLHDPPRSYGDCHRAALASLLDLPIDGVPNLMHGLAQGEGEIFQARQKEFLDARGFVAVQLPIQADDLKTACNAANVWNPGLLFLLGGESASGCGHTVVADGTGIVHDPHPDDVGIVGPMEDGCFWVTYVLGKI